VIHLRVPGSLRYRDLAVRVVGAACKLVGSDDRAHAREWDNEVVSAFGEAFNNTAIHSYDARQPGEVEIEVDPNASGITIRLIDHGKSFSIEDVPVPDLDALPESGLGLFIIRSFMDEVSYVPGSPNVLSMTKYVDRARRQVRQPSDRFQDSGGGDSRQ
jgi:serine/threonine-protein kinase RsbW